MLYSDLYGEVANNFGTSVTDSSRHKLWTNAAYHDIVSRSLWSWSERRETVTLATVGTSTVDLVANSSIPKFRALIDVVNLTTGQKLLSIDNAVLDRIAWSSTTDGKPALCCLAGGAQGATAEAAGGTRLLRIWPTVAASTQLAVRYYRHAADLSADGDIPMLPPQHHFAIVHKAIAIGAEMQDQLPMAQSFHKMAEERIQVMLAEEGGVRTGEMDTLTLRPLAAPAAG